MHPIEFYKSRNTELEATESTGPYAALDPSLIKQLATSFLHWQGTSIILAFGFIWYTQFFWHTVIVIGDRRYILQAFIIHGIWIFTWLIISLPLLTTWNHWQLARAKAIYYVISSESNSKDKTDSILSAIRDSQPISGWNAAVSGAAAILSLFSPFIHYIFR